MLLGKHLVARDAATLPAREAQMMRLIRGATFVLGVSTRAVKWNSFKKLRRSVGLMLRFHPPKPSSFPIIEKTEKQRCKTFGERSRKPNSFLCHCLLAHPLPPSYSFASTHTQHSVAHGFSRQNGRSYRTHSTLACRPLHPTTHLCSCFFLSLEQRPAHQCAKGKPCRQRTRPTAATKG